MNNTKIKLNHPSFDETSYGPYLFMVGALALNLANSNFTTPAPKHSIAKKYSILKHESYSSNYSHNVKLLSNLNKKTSPNRKLFANRMLALREKAIKKGMKLLNEDEILEEIKIRRGEFGIS